VRTRDRRGSDGDGSMHSGQDGSLHTWMDLEGLGK
jgi:hypothetical protein